MADQEKEKSQELGLIDITEILSDYLRIFRRMWAWVLIFTILGAGLSYVRARLQYQPVYTALSTLITLADNGNMKLVCVVLRTHGVNIYPDTKNLFEYAFNNFQKIQVADEKKPDEVEKFISAADSQSAVSAQSDGSEDTESVQTGGNEYQPLEDGHVILPKDVSYKDIDYEITDVDEDTGEGTIRYIYDGHQVGSAMAEFTDKYLQKVSTRKERVDSKPKDVDNSGDSKKNGGKSSAKSIWKNFLQKVKAVWDFGQKKFAGKSSTEKYMIAGGCVALVILIFSLIVLLIRRRR